MENVNRVFFLLGFWVKCKVEYQISISSRWIMICMLQKNLLTLYITSRTKMLKGCAVSYFWSLSSNITYLSPVQLSSMIVSKSSSSFHFLNWVSHAHVFTNHTGTWRNRSKARYVCDLTLNSLQSKSNRVGYNKHHFHHALQNIDGVLRIKFRVKKR